MNIAFIGLGKMGIGIAHRLLRASHSLRVWNRTPEKAEAFAVTVPTSVPGSGHRK